MAMATVANIASKGHRDHLHMLGCGRAWFKGNFPAEWERIRALPTEQGLNEMLSLIEAAI